MNGAGLDSVVRNSQGTVFSTHAKFQPGCDIIEIAEALAIARGSYTRRINVDGLILKKNLML